MDALGGKTLRFAALLPGMAVLLALTGGAVRAQAFEDLDGRRIESVRFEGVESVDRRELASALVTRPSRCRSFIVRPICWVSDGGFAVDRRYLDAEELARDELRIRVFYWRRGYRDARVATTATEANDAVDVAFAIRSRQEVEPDVLERVLHDLVNGGIDP